MLRLDSLPPGRRSDPRAAGILLLEALGELVGAGILLELAKECGDRVERAGMLFRPGASFDLVLNLFTSFGYFDDEADDRRVVGAAAAMLEPGSRFLLEVINGERIMRNFQEREWFSVGQTAVMERRSLDRSTRRMVVERTVSSPTPGSVVTSTRRTGIPARMSA